MQRILAESRKTYHRSELPAHLREVVKEAHMESKHADLHHLLEE